MHDSNLHDRRALGSDSPGIGRGRRVGLMALLLAAGCFNPSEDGGLTETEGSSTTPTTSTSSSAGTTASTATTTTTTASTTAPTTSAGSTTDDPTDGDGTAGGSSTGPVPGACSDDAIDPGQLCLAEYAEVEVAHDVLHVEVADLDGNDHLDLVLGGGGLLFTAIGDGTGSFSDGTSETAILGSFFGVGTVDADDNPDLAFPYEPGRWGVHFGDGTGNVGDAVWDVYGNEADASTFAIGDFDGAGPFDFAVAIPFQQSVRFFAYGEGANTSLSPGSAGEAYIGESCPVVIAADLSGGNFPHLVVGCTAGYVLVLDPSGDGSFVEDGYYTAGGTIEDVASCDFDGDGDLDVVAANSEDDVVVVFTGNGAGNLAVPPDEIDVGSSPGDGPLAVACGDIDNDGDNDIVTANEVGESVSIILGLGAEGFENFPTQIVINEDRRRDPSDVVLADINGDGSLDIVVANGYHDAAQEPVDFASVGVILSDP